MTDKVPDSMLVNPGGGGSGAGSIDGGNASTVFTSTPAVDGGGAAG